jgi:hypothetical protein
MRTDLQWSRFSDDILDLPRHSEFEPPATGSRIHPSLDVQWSHWAAPTKLELLGRIFDEAVRTDGIREKAVQDAWKVVGEVCGVLTVCPSCHVGFGFDPSQLADDCIVISTSAVSDLFQLHGTIQGNCRFLAGPGLALAGVAASNPDQPPDKKPGRIEGEFAQTAGWMEATNIVLQNSRAMTAAEHRLAIKALWTEVE